MARCEEPTDAKVTIVEFGDLECPACKKAQENLNKLMSEEPKARLIFQNFPLEHIHKWSLLAAKYVDCLGHQNNNAVWKFIGTTYDHQTEINEQNVEEKLNGFVKESGGDPLRSVPVWPIPTPRSGCASPSRWATS